VTLGMFRPPMAQKICIEDGPAICPSPFQVVNLEAEPLPLTSVIGGLSANGFWVIASLLQLGYQVC
jgi:hypothetical protein